MHDGRTVARTATTVYEKLDKLEARRRFFELRLEHATKQEDADLLLVKIEEAKTQILAAVSELYEARRQGHACSKRVEHLPSPERPNRKGGGLN